MSEKRTRLQGKDREEMAGRVYRMRAKRAKFVEIAEGVFIHCA